jgi:hypothetical protein
MELRARYLVGCLRVRSILFGLSDEKRFKKMNQGELYKVRMLHDLTNSPQSCLNPPGSNCNATHFDSNEDSSQSTPFNLQAFTILASHHALLHPFDICGNFLQ